MSVWRVIEVERPDEGEPPLECVLYRGKLFGILDLKSTHLQGYYKIFIVGFNPRSGAPVMVYGMVDESILWHLDNVEEVLDILRNPREYSVLIKKTYTPRASTVRAHLEKYMKTYNLARYGIQLVHSPHARKDKVEQ